MTQSKFFTYLIGKDNGHYITIAKPTEIGSWREGAGQMRQYGEEAKLEFQLFLISVIAVVEAILLYYVNTK